jgi:hypothetical protein
VTARLLDLIPGDEVTLAGRSAVFIARTDHPLYSILDLVIWRLDDGSWSHDALDPRQEVGEVTPSDLATRIGRLRSALGGA